MTVCDKELQLAYLTDADTNHAHLDHHIDAKWTAERRSTAASSGGMHLLTQSLPMFDYTRIREMEVCHTLLQNERA